MTPAEDLRAVISAALTSLAESVALEFGWAGVEFGWAGFEHIEAVAKEPGSALFGRLQGACKSHLDRAVSTIAAAGRADVELLVRTMLQIFLLEMAALTAQRAKAKE